MAGNRRIIMMAAATAMAAGTIETTTHAQCPPRYEITTILPEPNCGIFGTGAVFGKAMNDMGHITGSVYCFGGEQAFIWYGSGPWQLIPNPPGVTVLDSRGVDITSDGKVLVRINEGNGGGGFIYDGVTSTMLPPAPPQGTYFDPYEFDGSGDAVVGTWGNGLTGPGVSALRILDGRMELLEGIFGTPLSSARAISDDGLIAGWMGESLVEDAIAFVLDGTKHINLGMIDGATSVEPNAISNNGIVVGTAWYWDDPVLANRTKRAFVWQNGEFTDLGVRAPWTRSIAYDVNDSGSLIGSLTDGVPGVDGFLWLDGQMWNLDDLVDHPVPFSVRNAWDITNKGQILCEVWIDGTNHSAVVLSPVQRPDTDLNDDCVTNVLDLLALLGLWGDTGGQPNAADFNEDETVNVLDLLILLGQWSSM